jgi:hypothetical protein
MASEAAGGTGAGAGDQAVVAGVFADQHAGRAALEKLTAMGAQLRQAGVTGVLILSKDADGTVDARAADLPGASGGAGELEKRTIAALESLAGVQGHPDAPGAELGHALRPGAIALAVFVEPGSAPVVRMGLQNIGAQVLTDDDLRRIGAAWPACRRAGCTAPRRARARYRRPARSSTGRGSTRIPWPSRP